MRSRPLKKWKALNAEFRAKLAENILHWSKIRFLGGNISSLFLVSGAESVQALCMPMYQWGLGEPSALPPPQKNSPCKSEVEHQLNFKPLFEAPSASGGRKKGGVRGLPPKRS